SSIKLGADSPLCSGMPGIVVDADGVTIDLNGDTVQGDRTAGQNGIDAGSHAHVTIANGLVRGFDFGIFANGDGTKVANVVVRDCLSTGGVIGGEKPVVTKSAFVLNSGTGLRMSGNRPKVTQSAFVEN